MRFSGSVIMPLEVCILVTVFPAHAGVFPAELTNSTGVHSLFPVYAGVILSPKG